MSSREVSREIFLDEADPSNAFLVPLTEAGETTATVTSVTNIGRDPEQVAYYIKDQLPDRREYRQLSFLRAAGVPVPEGLVESSDGTRFATRTGGLPFHVASRSPETSANLLRGAGSTLRQIHQALNGNLMAETVLSPTFGPTAHIVDCFYYKYLGARSGVTQEDYVRHKLLVAHGGQGSMLEAAKTAVPPFIAPSEEFHPALAGLVTEANAIATGFAEKLQPYMRQREDESQVHITIPDQEICYGDFKPENILVDSDNARIRVIDPVLTKGSIYFDLAKFATRHLLDRLGENTDLSAFFEGYGTRPVEELKVYGPFTFSDLMAMDAINILKTYTKRFVAGDRQYRITGAMESPDFCNAYTTLLTTLSHIKTTKELDDLVFVNGRQVL